MVRKRSSDKARAAPKRSRKLRKKAKAKSKPQHGTRKKWYAYCTVRREPHPTDPATALYTDWQGPSRATYVEASGDARKHNVHAGHNAMVLNTT